MSKPVPLIVIERAREIISDPQRWCRGSFARGKAGKSVSPNDPNARRCCAMGALILAVTEVCSNSSDAIILAHNIAMDISPTGSLVFVNDIYGRDAVISLFDKAIATYQ